MGYTSRLTSLANCMCNGNMLFVTNTNLLYIMDASFRNLVEKFRNIIGALAIVANINFQEKLLNLEPAATHLV